MKLHFVFLSSLIIAILVVGCAPVDNDDHRPFDIRDGGKSKAIYVPPVVVLEDGVASLTCQGRPTEIRISDANRNVVGKIPVNKAYPSGDGWVATFPLFDGLSAYFKPGETYKVDCMGTNGTGGEPLKFKAYYTWSQAEADGFTRP